MIRIPKGNRHHQWVRQIVEKSLEEPMPAEAVLRSLETVRKRGHFNETIMVNVLLRPASTLIRTTGYT